jgi:hypothetical protein
MTCWREVAQARPLLTHGGGVPPGIGQHAWRGRPSPQLASGSGLWRVADAAIRPVHRCAAMGANAATSRSEKSETASHWQISTSTATARSSE